MKNKNKNRNRNRNRKPFAVLGLNTFGKKIVDILAEKGLHVIVVDRDKEQLYRYKDYAEVTAVAMDATDEEALKSVGIDHAEAAVVAMGTSVAESILITTSLKTLGIPEIIARAHSMEQVRALKRVGATRVVFPEEYSAENVAYSILAPGIKEFITIADHFHIAQVDVPQGFIGKSLGELNLIKRFGINVIAIKHYTKDDENTFREEGDAEFAQANYVLEGNDSLVIAGVEDNIEKFEEEIIRLNNISREAKVA